MDEKRKIERTIFILFWITIALFFLGCWFLNQHFKSLNNNYASHGEFDYSLGVVETPMLREELEISASLDIELEEDKNVVSGIGSWYEISAYNSTVDQTDDLPCISADNKNICERHLIGQKLCASNNFKLGSKIYIEGYGHCKIVDRMNRRYTNNIDIFFGDDIKKAREFGRRKMLVFVIK